MILESLQLNFGATWFGSGGRLQPSKLTEESPQDEDTALFPWKLAPKQTMAGLQVFFGKVLDPPHGAAFQVMADVSRHAQLVATRPPSILLLMQPGGE
jgi:hypothetical protein